ncbi:MAG: 2-phospho-L-lactate transferase [Pseudomonadota bacterium]
MTARRKVTLLAGGVGGAKMAEGLAALKDVDLSIIGNVADDDAFHGLWVSPDIDTLTYSLAGVIDRVQGWGVADEGLRALETLKTLGQSTWMTLGDRDLGLHIYRTMRRARGDRPSDIAADVAAAFGVNAKIVLPTDENLRTVVQTDAGTMTFQEYFVRERCRPTVSGIDFEGLSAARATPEAIAALRGADLVVIAPSNPLVSIGPIIALPEIRNALQSAPGRKVAVSPLIAGQAVKGPAAAMMTSMCFRADAVGVAKIYAGLIDTMVVDNQDAALADEIAALGMDVHGTNIMMRDQADKARLAGALLAMPARTVPA